MSSIDGYNWSTDQENKLNLAAVAVFGKPDGKAMLDYLKAITLNAVAGPGVTNDHLRHLEGQRYVVHLIERRIQAGHKLLESANNVRDEHDEQPRAKRTRK